MKYFRQSYLDLAHSAEALPGYSELAHNVMRFFDRLEIAYCVEWSRTPDHALLAELQQSNRNLTNEKNRYLAVIESLATPVLFVTPDGKLEDANRCASELLFDLHTSGGFYNAASSALPSLPDWMSEAITRVADGKSKVIHLEREITRENTTRCFQIRMQNSHDISGNFIGTAVIFNDITELKRAEAELIRIATHDKLTGLLNRREFETRMEATLRMAQRHALPLSVCICDIDHFKSVNDTHGHQAGDLVIAGFATIIRARLRSTDLAGRYGGDEFCLLFPGASTGQAVEALERIRREVEHWQAELPNGDSVHITGSFGVAECKGCTRATELIAAADRALYEAKRHGRNRVYFAPT
jgi:diguanylate cyclase (GGDEF)-like protein